METREMLERLPDPDPAAMARVWTRFEATRDADGAAQRWGWSWKLPAAGLALTAVAAATLLAVLPERARTVDLTSAGLHQWSEQIRLDLDGRGTATGTDQDLVVDWQSGTIRVEVEPHTGTKLSIVTDEGTIRVVGTVFSVRRDPLGVTTTVERGRVAVTCADGWSGEITVDDAHTCLPTRAAALLGRADALIAADAPTSTVLDALDRALTVVEPGTSVEGELLARRVQARSEARDVDGALADADRYLRSGQRSRIVEVQRTASRIALTTRGCAAAAPYLEALVTDGSAEDHVMLASCVAATDQDRARALAREGLAPDAVVDPGWAAWAAAFVQEGSR